MELLPLVSLALSQKKILNRVKDVFDVRLSYVVTLQENQPNVIGCD